jgi:hypothetical protein
MNVVSTVTSQLDKIRDRLFLGSISRSEKVYLHTTRFTVPHGNTTERLRVWILVRAKGMVEAESHAETRLKEILLEHVELVVADKDLKKLKPRELTVATLHDESEGILQLLHTMRREGKRVVSSVEKTEIN